MKNPWGGGGGGGEEGADSGLKNDKSARAPGTLSS